MSSEARPWRFRLQHILKAIAECRAFVSGMTCEQFEADAKTLKAVVWNLMTIGEAARHIPAEVVAQHPEIPWAQMRGMRNHNVHGYDQINLELVWTTVTEELTPIVPLLERLMSETVD